MDDENLAAITQDFVLLRDYHWGDHNKPLTKMIIRFGPPFLSPEQSTEFNKISGAPEQEREKWLDEQIGSKLKMFWYFVVCIWRNLQEEENPLAPEEAYWLGAVDEVAGTGLAGLRRTLENQQEKPKDGTAN